MDLDLAGKFALVTGAGRGIGRAITYREALIERIDSQPRASRRTLGLVAC